MKNNVFITAISKDALIVIAILACFSIVIILKETKNHRLYKLRQKESLKKVEEEEQKVVTKQEIKKQFT